MPLVVWNISVRILLLLNLHFLQISLHKLIHALLVNSVTRGPALDFLSAILSRNSKRQQMQVNERQVAGDGFMLNFLSVMQQLSTKVRRKIFNINFLKFILLQKWKKKAKYQICNFLKVFRPINCSRASAINRNVNKSINV